MKLQFVCGAFMFNVNSQRIPNSANKEIEDTDRRYYQLMGMMKFYNKDFDDRKFFAYGCQCLLLGDRAMVEPGHGAPVDALDYVCKQYKDCLKCARMTHGEYCIPEVIKYNYKLGNGDVTCNDNPEENAVSACKRSLCVCDAAFAVGHSTVAELYNRDFHVF